MTAVSASSAGLIAMANGHVNLFGMATLDHSSFTQPSDPNVPVWRYMDLSKFAALLQRRALVFARADQLNDPFEGSVPKLNAEALDAILEIREKTPEKDPYKGIPDELLKRMFSLHSESRRQSRKTVYINCWHMNEVESAAMWKLYAASGDAVCVKTNYRRLADSLPDRCYMGAVKYIDFNTDVINASNLFNPYTIKRRSFAHEREARALIWDPDVLIGSEEPPLIIEQAIDLSQMVESISLSPDAPSWLLDVVVDLAQRYELSAPVSRSELNSPAMY